MNADCVSMVPVYFASESSRTTAGAVHFEQKFAFSSDCPRFVQSTQGVYVCINSIIKLSDFWMANKIPVVLTDWTICLLHPNRASTQEHDTFVTQNFKVQMHG